MLKQFVLAIFVLALGACAHDGALPKPDAADRLIAAEMAARHIPGLSFAVWKDGTVVDQRSYGTANLETWAPATNDTVYAIGSITKSMTAITVLRLQEMGLVVLDEPVSRYVADLPDAWRNISVRHLMSNVSGIPDIIDNPCAYEQATPYQSGDILNEVACLPLNFEPGEQFEYANSNFVLLSVMIERVTRRPLGEVFASEIFEPLGMAHTGMLDYVSVIPQRADGYLWTDDGYLNSELMDVAAESGAGGVLSTTGDMLKFISAIERRELLSAGSWERAFVPYPVREGTTPYALGFGVTPYEGHPRVGHSGSAVGFASSFSYFPDDGVGIILLSNGYEEPHGRSVSGLANDVAALYFSPPEN